VDAPYPAPEQVQIVGRARVELQAFLRDPHLNASASSHRTSTLYPHRSRACHAGGHSMDCADSWSNVTRLSPRRNLAKLPGLASRHGKPSLSDFHDATLARAPALARSRRRDESACLGAAHS